MPTATPLSPHSPSAATRAQHAVSGLFFCYGLLFATLGLNAPLLRDSLGLSDGQLGLGLLAVSVGSFVTMPLTGRLVERWGSARLVRLGSVLTFAALLLPFAAWSLPSLAAMFALLGLANGVLDVSLSSQGVTVEKAAGRTVMSRLHAFYSLGGLCGALVGGLLVGRVTMLTHAGVVTALTVGLALWAASALLPDPPTRAQTASEQPTREKEEEEQTGEVASAHGLRSAAYMVGALCFLGMFTEGANYDWVSVYYRDVLEVAPSQLAWGYGAFTGAMALGRFVGDRVRARIGDEVAVRGGALLAAAGMALALLFPTPLTSTLGFALSGLGLSNVVPVLFSAAGHALGSRGIALVATIGYIGFLLGPPLIGFLSDAVGLPYALATAAAGGVAIAVAGGPVFARLLVQAK